MIPDRVLSSEYIPSEVIGGRAIDCDELTDYEDGGIALNDASEGLMYQIWRGRVVGNDIILDVPDNPHVHPTILYTGDKITSLSFTFDQNMRPTMAFVQDEQTKLYWYDSNIASFTITNYGDALISPKVFLDDKREMQRTISDILFAYTRGNNLYLRAQRDRFLVEYLLREGVRGKLVKLGMGRNLRVQFRLTEYS